MIGSFDQKPGCINPDVQRQTIEALLASASVPSSRFLRPEFIRLAPPLHTSDDEVRARSQDSTAHEFYILMFFFHSLFVSILSIFTLQAHYNLSVLKVLVFCQPTTNRSVQNHL